MNDGLEFHDNVTLYVLRKDGHYDILYDDQKYKNIFEYNGEE